MAKTEEQKHAEHVASQENEITWGTVTGLAERHDMKVGQVFVALLNPQEWTSQFALDAAELHHKQRCPEWAGDPCTLSIEPLMKAISGDDDEEADGLDFSQPAPAD